MMNIKRIEEMQDRLDLLSKKSVFNIIESNFWNNDATTDIAVMCTLKEWKQLKEQVLEGSP